MINQSKRKFIKGAAYGSALVISGLSSVAFVELNSNNLMNSTSDIHLLTTNNSADETLSLFNHTEKSIVLDSIDKLSLGDERTLLAVRVNQSGKSVDPKRVTLAPGEYVEVLVLAATTTQYEGEVLSSDHPAFNGDIPVTIFDSKAA